MEKLEFDVGLVEYAVPGGGALRFNPADPALYGRFARAAEQLAQMEQELTRKGQNAEPGQMLELLNEADSRAKALLNETFGAGNDFHKALNGISLLAVSSNGKTVAENLFTALEAVLERGAQRLVEEKLAAAKDAL